MLFTAMNVDRYLIETTYIWCKNIKLKKIIVKNN